MAKRKKMTNKGKKFPAKAYNHEQMNRLLSAPSKRAPTGVRNRALLYIGYRCGLRISEALSLKPDNIDFTEGVIHIERGKGGKPRLVALPDDARLALQTWMEKRKQLKINTESPIFCTITQSKKARLKKGSPLTTAYIRALMKRLGEKAGIHERVHFHGLRHTFAKVMVQGDENPRLIQGALGHTSLKTTDKYLTSIAPLEIIEAMKRAARHDVEQGTTK